MALPKASRSGQVFESRQSPKVGTVPAFMDYKPKVRAVRGASHASRNRADRVSSAITEAQAQAILAAVTHANKIGLPLNRLLTIHWSALGVPDEKAATATGRLLKLFREALEAKGLATAWAYVRENDEGDGTKGSHVHILAHIPAAAGERFMRRLRTWARLAAGGRYDRRGRRVIGAPPYVRGAVHTARIGGRVSVPSEQHAINLAEALGYALKGADNDATRALGLSRLEPGGRVIGKRCGWSQNIGAAARQKA